MTDTESGKERRHQVERYRVLARETTDPLASGLLRDIVSELEADLKELAEDALWSLKGGQLEDTSNLHWLGLRRDSADDLLRREATGDRLGHALQLQAEAAARSLWRS